MGSKRGGASKGSGSTHDVLWGSFECLSTLASARPPPCERALKLLVFGFTSSSSGWIWAHASHITVILIGTTLAKRAVPHRQAPSRKFQTAARSALGDRARWASHSRRLSFSPWTLFAAGRGVVTPPGTAGRAPPRGEHVATRLTYSGRLERAPHAVAATGTNNSSKQRIIPRGRGLRARTEGRRC